jgi:Tat protein translocase TatB subunit
MEIFNVGIGEMLMIAIVALVVFGPDKLPEMARRAARAWAELNRMTAEVNAQFQRELNSVEEPLREARNLVQPIAAHLSVPSELANPLKPASVTPLGEVNGAAEKEAPAAASAAPETTGATIHPVVPAEEVSDGSLPDAALPAPPSDRQIREN